MAVDKTGRKRGEAPYMGFVPYGYSVGLVPNHLEMQTMARAHELKEQGLSLRDIASQLAIEGRLSRKGRIFKPQQILILLGQGKQKAT